LVDNEGAHNPVADIVVFMGGITYFLDVAITDPTSKSALRKGSDAFPDRASDIEASRIRAKYRNARYRGHNGGQIVEGVVFPFVVENTGRIGKDAIAFLNLLHEGGSWQRSVLLGVISITCAKYTSRMLSFHDPLQNENGVHNRIQEPEAPEQYGRRHIRFADGA
jgi:hypothetical protein